MVSCLAWEGSMVESLFQARDDYTQACVISTALLFTSQQNKVTYKENTGCLTAPVLFALGFTYKM